MPRVRLRFAHLFTAERLGAKKPALADLLAQQTRDRIEAGGDPDAPIAPTHDGRKALANPGFLNTIRGFTTDRGVSVESTHVNARRLLLGTVGKGGSMEPIRPKKGKWLWAMFPQGLRRFLESEFAPRKYLAFTQDNLRAFARVILGRG